MNPYRRLRKYVIGEALSLTDDVFEQARIDLLFNITLFFLCLGLGYYGNLIAHHYTWLIYITTIGVISLPTVLIILKKTKSAQLAGYFFMAEQILIGFLNQCVRNFTVDATGAFWSMFLVLFAFFVMGTRWGLAIAAYMVATLFIGLSNEQTNFSYFHFNIPVNQVPPPQPYFIFLPMFITIYSVYKMVATRKVAEKHIGKQKNQLEKNNRLLESKNEDILSSIQYAKRIQKAVLPPEERVQRDIPLSFIIYKPKDIVSGDFFWFHSIDSNKYILAVADCTGHGVPGAFMTVIGSNLLNQIVIENKLEAPGKILSELDIRLTATLRQEKQHHGLVQDGMDISIIAVDKLKKQILFSSAKRPAILIRDGKMAEFKGSKSSIGGLRSEEKQFKEITIDFEEDDCLYLYSDGVVDQFGGSQNKKFTSKRLREKLITVSVYPVHRQQKEIEEMIQEWKGGNEQTDDMIIAGIRF
jgi:serine phosphatase RsbU (regulator of sigma subunit)